MKKRGTISSSQIHLGWMRECIELARTPAYSLSPNPYVGAVVLDRGGKLVATGFHKGPGKAHGEIEALKKAGKRAKGGTLYVNLEPCRHEGRTPPCAPAVLASGIKTLVFGSRDPIEGHRGGAAWLRKKGVAVIGPVLETEALRVNRGFYTNALEGRCHVIAKAGVSLDGKVATRSGVSKWVTSAEARKHARIIRGQVDVILVGVGTVIDDNPRLTSRVSGVPNPVRVVLDSSLRTPLSAKLLGLSGKTIIATTKAASVAKEKRLVTKGATVWRLPSKAGRVSVKALLSRLHSEDLCQVLVEGGATVHGAFADAGCIDEVLLYVAPVIIGGIKAPSWVGGKGNATLKSIDNFEPLHGPVMVGPDVHMHLLRKTR